MKKTLPLIALTSLLFMFGPIPAVLAAPFKVLAVMSYHPEMPWARDVKAGIDAALSETCHIHYAYLDTRRRPEEGAARAKDAFARYQTYQPDGVIAADDAAQSLFVVPYLKDRVPTPVVFCGVNAEPEKYGYPATNVTGILERMHFNESIAFVQQLAPSVATVCYLMGDTETAQGDMAQIRRNADAFSARSGPVTLVQTLDQALTAARDLRSQCDAMYIEHMVGVRDENGDPLDEEHVVPRLAEAFGKPTFGANSFIVKFGLLCAVVKTGQEQGRTAGEMLLNAMRGTPVAQIPVTRNRYGKRMLNVTVMKELGIRPRPNALAGVELVRTER